MEIESGCWVQTQWGPAVCIQRHPNFATYRYEAERMSGPDKGKTIWVLNGDVIAQREDAPAHHVRYLRPADGESRRVLQLRGPYGEG